MRNIIKMSLVIAFAIQMTSCASLFVPNVPTSRFNTPLELNEIPFRLIQVQTGADRFYVNAVNFYYHNNDNITFTSVVIRTDNAKKADITDINDIMIVADGKTYQPSAFFFYAYGGSMPSLDRAMDYGSGERITSLSPPLNVTFKSDGTYTILVGYSIPKNVNIEMLRYHGIEIKLENFIEEKQTWDMIKE